MKKLKFPKPSNFKILQKIFLIIGSICGFSTSIVAQYGAPMAQYKVSGTIISKICEEPIPNIKVTVYQSPEYKQYGETCFTDSLGHFEHVFYSDYWNHDMKIYINAEDTDSTKNKGIFLPIEKLVEANRYSYYDTKNNNSGGQIIKMSYSGKPPCKNEIPLDTVLKPVPMIKLSDSTLIEPGFVAEVYEQALADTVKVIAPPINPEDNVFIVFPNPSQGVFHINFKTDGQSLVTAYVYDASSKMIIYNKWNKEAGLFDETIDISAFSPGSYYLVVFSGKEKYMKKLIKE